MAAAVKHARIGNDVSSPNPGSHGKYLQTSSGVRKNSTMLDPNSAATSKTSNKPEDAKSSATADALSRRRSTFKGVAASLMNMRRMTKGSMDKDMVAAAAAAAAAAKPKVRLENTYQLSPTEEQKFRSCKAEQVIREVLQNNLAGQTYNAVKAPTQAASLSEQVKAAVKKLHCDRFKLVTNVVLGPVRDQGMVVASRCLWDSSTDNSSTVTFNNGTIFAIASIFAVYYE